MATSDGASFIDAMPKAELHLHIEGTFEPELRFELAARNGISLPFESAAQLRAAYSFHDLTSFLVGYYEAMSVLRTEQDFYDLAMAYFRTASAQNVVYAEVFLPGDLGHRVIFIAIVHRFELAAVNRNHRSGEQAQLAAQHHKLGTRRPDRPAIVFAEVGNRLEVRRQPPSQPHQLDIALCFPFETPARLHAVEIAVEVDLQ
jgi:hypothetical protein